MKLPISWLREWVDVDATPERIADALTRRGFYVEGIETHGASMPVFRTTAMTWLPGSAHFLDCVRRTADHVLRRRPYGSRLIPSWSPRPKT